MKHNEIRARELRALAKVMASQFGITNPLDVQALENELLSKYANGVRLTSQYSTSNAASSAKFRSDVRNVLIDLIATYGHIEAIDKNYANLEANVRALIDRFDFQLETILSDLVNSDIDNTRHVRGNDLFNNLDDASNLEYIHGRLRPTHHRIPVGLFSTVDISSTIYPEPGLNNEVLTTTTGTLASIIRSGLASKVWSVDVYTKSPPKFDLLVSGLESITDTSLDATNLTGIVQKLTFDFSDTATILPTEMEIRFQQKVNIIGVLIDGVIHTDSDGNPITTINLKRDHLVNLPGSSFNSLSLYVHVPSFSDEIPYSEILADQYTAGDVYIGAILNPDGFTADIDRPDYFHYELGIYNVKLRTSSTEPGTAVTKVYQSYSGALADASFTHFGKGLTDSHLVVTPYWHLPNGLFTDTKPVDPTPVTESYTSATLTEEFSSLVLDLVPYITSIDSLVVQIALADGSAPRDVEFIMAPNNEIPQFSLDDSLQCFLIGNTLIFKTGITLAEGETITIDYDVLLTGVHYTIVHSPDAWTGAYTVTLHDNIQ
jgi:hypothetical protein